jgi:endonuclease III
LKLKAEGTRAIGSFLLFKKMKPKNLDKVYKIFGQKYELIPLEVFHNNAYKTLISTLLSSRTNDDTTLKVCRDKLFKKAKSIQELDRLQENEIRDLIYPVGFYKTKAKHIKKLTKLLIDKYKGQIPKTREELMELPGVGRKTANLVLNRAFNIPAIAVDTHVHRISNLLGWVKTKTPQETEKKLMEILPKEYWTEMNKFFVSIGRRHRSQRQILEFLNTNKLI